MNNHKPPYPYSEVGHYETKYGLMESHDSLLEVIMVFDDFCQRHDIKYSIADGTLLGALRHGDFVPWDDDADVMVTREEYKKIRAAIQFDESIRLVKIRFLDRVTTPAHSNKGYYIDLFINDEMPKSRWQFYKRKYLTYLLRCSFANNGMINFRRANYLKLVMFIRSLIGELMKFIAKVYVGKRDVFELNDEIVELGTSEGSGIYTRFTSRMYETKRRFNKEKYDEGYQFLSFRGKQVMAIKNASLFLREMYGNFETMPSEENRKPEHIDNMLLDSPEWGMKKYYKD